MAVVKLATVYIVAEESIIVIVQPQSILLAMVSMGNFQVQVGHRLERVTRWRDRATRNLELLEIFLAHKSYPSHLSSHILQTPHKCLCSTLLAPHAPHPNSRKEHEQTRIIHVLMLRHFNCPE